MLASVIRVKKAPGPSAKTKVGMTMCCQLPHPTNGRRWNVAEDVDEEDGRDETGDRGPHGGYQKAQVVDGCVLLQRADDPERDREHEREYERLNSELRGGADALADQVHDRASAREA